MRNLLPLLIVIGLSLASQPVGHAVGGRIAWQYTDSVCRDMNMEAAKPILKPLAAIGSHIVMDRVIGEVGLGEYQIDIAIVRLLIGYALTPDKDKDEYIQYAFWSISPDIIDKGFGSNIFHQGSGKTIFNQNRDTNELLEELGLLSFSMKIKF
jgi:hypothetical protein